MKNSEIFKIIGLSIEEICEVKKYLSDEAYAHEFYGSKVYYKLYDYFTTDTFEMPYGVAKCRTGEPDVWIIDRLSQ
jgi:hypothetical protein